ncbi:hypothetical protein GOODEAATRI_012357, partial [Goodea atripinnis]
QMESIGLLEQKKALLKRLADTEAENAEKAKSSADVSRTLESTRAHLQGQLRTKEAENNRLSNLERAANQQRAEMDHVTEQLNRLKKEALDDREALKRATRSQKQRAERSEDAAGQLSLQLLQM